MAASTGSPASRRLTKLMPLTTRPSLTSRQGMTRTLNMGRSRPPRGANHAQRFGSIEPSVIKRPAGDGAFQLARARLGQLLHVLNGGKPTAGDHRDRNRIVQRDGGVPVDALQHTVA